MVIAVTGGTGFIGRRVVHQLLARGHRVRALRRPTSRVELLQEPPQEWVSGDAETPEIWERLLSGVDALVHLAAAGVANIGDVFDAVHINFPMHAHLLAAASKHGVRRVVLAGSCFEYGRTGESVGDRGLREDDRLDPVNVYGAVKAAITLITGPLSRDLGLETFLMRPFHVYGPGELGSRLVPSVISAALSGRRITSTDGRQIRDFIHIDDVADGFARAVEARWPAAVGQSGVSMINLASGVGTSVADMVRLITQTCGRAETEIEFGAVKHRQNEMWRLVGDWTAARDLLGWKPTITLPKGIEALVISERARREGRS
ncbi:UDP-glucose 4-epimerase [mine drainage metagenome]|uniref:UDP-glucose 4-epimerase n=1 Tax=mine drainage metagenome TaxID=410659 RepID=A0A1J5RLG9_9ZZZZ